MVNQARRIGRLPKCPISAYSASPPVITSTTEPRTRKPATPSARKKSMAYRSEPGQADRAPPEVPHIGVQRLAAGDHQHHRAEDQEAGHPVSAEEVDGVQIGTRPGGSGASRSAPYRRTAPRRR